MRVLVCKVGGLGDSLSMLPTAAAVRRHLPTAGVTILCSAVGKAVFEQTFDGVSCIGVDRALLRGVKGLCHVRELAARIGPVDVALLSHDETTAVHVVAACVARRRIGFAAGIARGEALLTDRLAFSPNRNVVDITLDLARCLLERPDLGLTRVAPGPTGPGTEQRYGIVHPGAATTLQRWGGFSEAARRLAVATGYPWNTINAADGLSIPVLVTLFARAEGFLGNHSGPLHLAAALGRPYVAVAGPSAPAWDPPWPDVSGCVLRRGLPCQPCGRLGRPARHCSNARVCLDVPVEAVVEAMLRILRHA